MGPERHMTEMKSIARHGLGRGCVITRRACFSASHRYWLPELSADDNAARFGPCALAPGHGHNYELIVSMGGELDADGMVLNLSDVKHAIRHEVTGQLDFHKKKCKKKKKKKKKRKKKKKKKKKKK